jgi:hypothetical protein
MGIGLCVLSAPELVVGAVIVTGVVVVGLAIKEALDAYEKGVEPEEIRPSPETESVSETKPAPRNPLVERRPKPEPKGPDVPPLGPIETSVRERRPECRPMRTLWDVKTDDFDKQPPRSQRFFVKMKLPELRREARLARECGYDFVIGVRSASHKAVLLEEDPTLEVAVMYWC